MTIQLRRGLASALAGATMADGEPAWLTDTHLLYISQAGTKYLIGGGVTSAVDGGTGQSVYVVGDTLYASTTTALSKLGIGSAGQVLTVAGGVPTWATPAAGYSDEAAQDAVGGILTDTATIDFTYNDGANTITASVINDSITDAKLRNSAGLSIIGRTANSTGDPADIVAGFDGQVLVRRGTVVEFSALDLTASFSTVFELPAGKGGTGWGSYVAGDILYALTSITLAKLGIGSAGDVLTVASGVPSWAAPAAAATQANQETATSTTTYVSPGRQQYHPSAAKGWINFDGTGTIAINGSYNVSSITDNGTGDYTINWDVDFSSANYCWVGTCDIDTSTHNNGPLQINERGAKAAASLRIQTNNSAAAATDMAIINVVAYGDQ